MNSGVNDPVDLAERIVELATQHGSLRAAARVLEVDHGYLSRLKSGEKDDPSDALLRKMGLRRVVVYERVRRETKTVAFVSPEYERQVAARTTVSRSANPGQGNSVN